MSEGDSSKKETLEELFGSDEAKKLAVSSAPPQTYLFVSFDLLESTQLKEHNVWVEVLWHFFDAATSYSKGQGFYLWKYRGDEALFFAPLSNNEDVSYFVEAATDIAERLNKDFENDDRFTIALDSESRPFFPKVKATAWVGVVHQPPSGKLSSMVGEKQKISKENVLLKFGDTVADHGGAVEFLGSDIDAGFRIAEAASPYAISLSLQLVKLIVEKPKYKNKIRLVGHRMLKGVSDGTHWPIFWYSPSWSRFKRNVANERRRSNSDMYGLAAIDFEKFVDKKQVDRFIRRYGLNSEMKRLNEHLQGASPNTDVSSVFQAEGSKLTSRDQQLHCVAVCFNPHGEVLLGKRKKKLGSPLSEKWEFGCSQLDLDLGFFESVRQDYLHDFGVEVLELIEPPVKTFVVDGKETPGIIFAARISSKKPSSNKHQEVLMSAREFFTAEEDQCVSGFFDTWSAAQEVFERGGDGKG